MTQFRLNSRRALIGAFAGVAALTVSLSGQTTPTDTRPIMTENWKTARTPWGDPDLQGIYGAPQNGFPVAISRTRLRI
jgi:hypothetical protein